MLVAACHAELAATSSPSTGPDAGHQAPPVDARSPDAAIDAVTVAADNACGVPDPQGELGTLSGLALVAPQSPTTNAAPWIYAIGAPSPESAQQMVADWAYVELWDGYGAFTGASAHPGTFPITGDETSYDTCGICVFTLANDGNGSIGSAAHLLLATSGTVIVHAVGATSGSPLQVEVQGATFQEIDPISYAPVMTSSCPSQVSHVALDGVVQ